MMQLSMIFECVCWTYKEHYLDFQQPNQNLISERVFEMTFSRLVDIGPQYLSESICIY